MANLETVIGPETRIAGELRGEEDVIVRGRVEGRVQLTQTLTVDEGGIVQADVDVKNLIVSGVLVGNITASDSVRLTDTARVIGDLNAPRVVIEAGAAFRGRVDMGDIEGVRKAGAAATQRPADRQADRKVERNDDRAVEKTAARPAPRMTAPPRETAAAAPRLVAPPARPAAPRPAPPTMPRAEGAASAPAWAKKKQLRRR